MILDNHALILVLSTLLMMFQIVRFLSRSNHGLIHFIKHSNIQTHFSFRNSFAIIQKDYNQRVIMLQYFIKFQLFREIFVSIV